MYLTAAQAVLLVDGYLGAKDPRRLAFNALDDAGRAACLLRAGDDFDGMLWLARAADVDQLHAWPRLWPGGKFIDAPADSSGQTLPGTPLRVERAVAIQAAHHAERDAGVDPTRYAEEQAHRGLGSGNPLALQAAARLCSDAWRLVAKYAAARRALTVEAR